jgi:hypothetical protein
MSIPWIGGMMTIGECGVPDTDAANLLEVLIMTITGKVLAVVLATLYPHDTSWREMTQRIPASEFSQVTVGGLDLSTLPLPHQLGCLLGIFC